MFYGKTYVQPGFCFSGRGKTEACCGRFLEQKIRVLAVFILEQKIGLVVCVFFLEQKRSCAVCFRLEQFFFSSERRPDLSV